MNKSSIEWCDYTWNPVSGCYHACRDIYCYNTIKKTSPLNRFGARYLSDRGEIVSEKDWRARETGKPHEARKGEIYPFGYDSTIYRHRLKEPLKVKEPAKIFVVDVGDLFGAWVPQEWIEQVLDVTKQCPQHTFQFLTKNPKRLLEFEFGSNCWVGTTVNSDKDTERAEIVKKVSALVRFLSIEPLLGEVTFDLRGFQWLIIGAQTGKNPPLPADKWIEAIVTQAGRLAISVFMKDNLRQGYSGRLLKDYPGVDAAGINQIKHLQMDTQD